MDCRPGRSRSRATSNSACTTQPVCCAEASTPTWQTQLDMYGIHSYAMLVTKVTEGTPGTSPGDVPSGRFDHQLCLPGNSGFGTYYASMPSPSGTKTSFKFLTPLIDIPTWSTYNASAGLTDVSFYDPFAAP